jgi:uncharacterized membrane protein
LVGLVLFLGVHSVRIFADDWRTAKIASMGALPWKGAYAVASIVAFALIVWGYGMARQAPIVLWAPPAGMKHVTAVLMVPVFILFFATYVPRNMFKARLKHPQVLSVKLWALAHLMSNGTLADVLLFGSFLAWAVLNFRAARQRDRAAAGPQQPVDELSSQAMRLSFGLEQRSMLMGNIICVVIGLVVYALFVMGLHQFLIGVRPV